MRRPSDTSNQQPPNIIQDFECNLCKKLLASEPKLREHLVEHTFAGCEDRGFICYICSSVFTGPSGLLPHMEDIHGSNAKPYDCSRCAAKFFFRAELDHHAFTHEPLTKEVEKPSIHEPEISVREGSLTPQIKKEVNGESEAEEEEYIEVEEPRPETTFKQENGVATNESSREESPNNVENKNVSP